MAVSEEEIRWAYRMFLDREPESKAAVASLTAAPNLAALRGIFTSSLEFRTKVTPHQPLLGVDKIDVQVECSSQEAAQMLARISTEWRQFGDTEPHWSVLTGDEYRADNIGLSIDRFYNTGGGDIEHLLGGVRRAGFHDGAFGKALDFGCGVGRLTLALAPRCKTVLGIDISPAHVRLAEQRAQQAHVQNATFLAINDLDALDAQKDAFDLVTSFIVLQHNPPPIMAIILRKLLAALAPGGFAVIQLPTYLAITAHFSVSRYLANQQPPMEMNALPQRNVFEIIDKANCVTVEVREDHAIGALEGMSQVFTVRKRAERFGFR